MPTPDVNVLVAAARGDHRHHGAALRWLQDAIGEAQSKPLLLFPMVAASFLRLVVHPRIFTVPMPGTLAVAFVDTMLGAPGVVMPPLGEEWPRLRDACAVARLDPNVVPDLWLAAAVREAGDHLVTFDAGFRRLLRRSELTVLTG